MNPQKLIDNFSTHLKNTIARAISLAAYTKHTQVDPIHLLIALTQEAGSVAGEILKKCKVTEHDLLSVCVKPNTNPSTTKLRSIQTKNTLPELSQASRHVLEKSLLLAYEHGHQYIGTEHLLSSLINANDQMIEHALHTHNISHSTLEQYIETVLQNTSSFTGMSDLGGIFEHFDSEEEQTHPTALPPLPFLQTGAHNKKHKQPPALEQFTVNLTDKQHQKNVDPVVGREHEIDRIVHVLARRTKNNPILIGEPGVGKTAIVEGLAKKVLSGDVPEILKRKKILCLDLTLLIAGTIYRGEFESRLKQIIDELAKKEDHILFIDEIHNIIGAGSNQGTLDAANILKPALARGQLRCIGATTFDEYKKYIASDPALERRFEKIVVEEPDTAATLEILEGVKKYYEAFHRLNISKKALEAAVTFSDKYVHDKQQPDKSIDLIDEAAAAVRSNQKPTAQMQKYHTLLEQRDAYEVHKKQAIEEEKLQIAANWKRKIEVLDKKIEKLNAQIENQTQTRGVTVREKHIAAALAKKLNIDLDVVLSNEWDILQKLERRIKKHIVGQDTAVTTLVETLQQSYMGISRAHKPFASFLFAGPSGVGKTELSRVLAKELYHDEKALVRLDMSEFAEAHSVSKILGAPAGYVGHKDRNYFLEEVMRRPYSVILFDEIDKAHPDVLRLLLQILDDGQITDSAGKTIHFKQAIIILTTNLGADLFKSAGIGFGASKHEHATSVQKEVEQKLKQELSAALLSRLDATCLFYPLNKKAVERIIKNYIARINQELSSKNNITIDADKHALRSIIQDGYSADFGVRNIELTVQKIINQLMIDLIRTRTIKDTQVTLTHNKNEYDFIPYVR